MLYMEDQQRRVVAANVDFSAMMHELDSMAQHLMEEPVAEEAEEDAEAEAEAEAENEVATGEFETDPSVTTEDHQASGEKRMMAIFFTHFQRLQVLLCKKHPLLKRTQRAQYRKACKI